ncbi:hypothetical protein ACO0QE_000120 [Hanseniaspora vineae]
MAMKKLKIAFNKDIVSTIEHHLSNKEIIDRLGDLHEELSHIDQENTKLESLDKYRAQLIDKKLLKNKDGGIQAFTACCLSDILRIYAPDAPYTESELTDIFKLFFTQFKMLTKLDNGYYIQQVYLLTKLVEVRSIVLITDLPQAEKLVHELFKVFYNPENNDFPTKLVSIISDLLDEVISETDAVSVDVLKLIFNKFLTYNPHAAPKGLQIAQDSSFQFSLHICENGSGRLGRYLTKFYTEMLYDVSRPSSSSSSRKNIQGDENEDNNGDRTFIDEITSVSHPGYKVLTKLHTLVLNLWEYVPELVSAVSGFLNQELYSTNELFRISTTKLVGDILRLKNPSLNFVTTCPEVFKAWLAKIADSSPKVRISWVKTLPGVLNSGSSYVDEQLCSNICQGLSKTLIDTDFKVRYISIVSIKEINTETVWSYFKSPVIFNELLHLAREKNKDIREAAIKFTCEFYRISKSKQYHLLIPNAKLSEVFSKIPSTIMSLYYINDKSINALVDTLFVESILPFEEEDDEKRVETVLELVSTLDEKAKQSFFAFNKRQVELHSVVYKFMNMAEELNSIDNTESAEYKNLKFSIDQIIKWLAVGLSDSFNITTILETLAHLNNKRLFELLKLIVSSETSYTQLLKHFRELREMLKDNKLFASVKLNSMFTKDEFSAIVQLLSYRSAFIIYNKSNISIFLEKTTSSGNKNEETRLACTEIVEHISLNIPSAFKHEVSSLMAIIKTCDIGDESALETLKTLYRIGKVKLEYIDQNDSFFIDRLMDFMIKGTPFEAQYSCKLLLLMDKSEKHIKSLLDSLLPINDTVTPSQIMILSEVFASQEYELLSDRSTDIVTYVLANILLSNAPIISAVENDENEWIDDQKLCFPDYAEIAKKSFGLELITNHLISLSKNLKENEEEKETLITKSLKLFFFLIESGGELIVRNEDEEEGDDQIITPVQYQKKLRLLAGLQILKLAEHPVLNNFITSLNVEKLVNLVEDESLIVRTSFLKALKKCITDERISIKFLPLMFFVAFEPDKELKKQVKLWINFTSSKKSFQKTTFFERGFSRFIHYIAHHPDIYDQLSCSSSEDTNKQVLSNAVEYVLYYFENILKKENITLLFYLSNRVKQYQDIDETVPESSNIYIISEIIQLILVEYKEIKNWDIPVYQGRLNLPTDLYVPITDPKKQNSIIMTNFLKDEQVTEIKKMLKSKSIGSRIGGAMKKKATNEFKKNQKKSTVPTKRRKQTLKNDDSDDEDSYTVSKIKADYTKVRQSSRVKQNVNYEENDSTDGEDEDEYE